MHVTTDSEKSRWFCVPCSNVLLHGLGTMSQICNVLEYFVVLKGTVVLRHSVWFLHDTCVWSLHR